MNKRAKILENLSGLDLAELFGAANTQLGLDGISIAQIADEAGTRTARVYAYQSADAGTLTTIMAIIRAQARHGAPFVLDRIARDSGYYLVSAPPVVYNDKTALCAGSKALREAAEAIESFSAAVDDGVATDEEIESVSRQVAEACDAFHALKGCLEALRIRKERRQ